MEGSPLFSGWKAKGPARWRGLRRAIGLLCLPAHRKEGASCSLRPLVSSVSVVPDQAPPGSTSHGRGVAAGLSVMITRETATVQPGAGRPSPTRSLGFFALGTPTDAPGGPGYVHGASALQVPCQSQAGRWRGRIMSTPFRKKKVESGPPAGRPPPTKSGRGVRNLRRQMAAHGLTSRRHRGDSGCTSDPGGPARVLRPGYKVAILVHSTRLKGACPTWVPW